MNTFQEVAAGNIKLIQKPDPPFYAFCTACRQQYLDVQKWIDLGASYDGGVAEVNGLLATVDDVHLCERCAEIVGRLMGMDYNDDLEEKIAKLETENRSLRGKLAWIENQAKREKK